MVIILYIIITFIFGGIIFYFDPFDIFFSEEQLDKRDTFDMFLSFMIAILWPVGLVMFFLYFIIKYIMTKVINMIAFCDGFVKGTKRYRDEKKSN